jgi:hypothetical protein
MYINFIKYIRITYILLIDIQRSGIGKKKLLDVSARQLVPDELSVVDSLGPSGFLIRHRHIASSIGFFSGNGPVWE